MTDEIPPTDTPAPTSQQPVIPETAAVPGARATLGQRIPAAVIDCLVATALGWVASMIMDSLYFPAWAGYMLTRDSLPFLGGQSVGKKALNLRAVSASGKSLSGDWNTGLLRNISMAIPLGALVELIVLLANKEKPDGHLRLGDQWAKTKVVTAVPQDFSVSGNPT